MAAKMKDIVNDIFKKIEDAINQEDSVRIITSVDRYLEFQQEIDKDVFNFITKSQVKQISVANICIVLEIIFKEERYIVFPIDYIGENTLKEFDLEIIELDYVIQGSKILAINKDCVSIKREIESIQLINKCMGIEPDKHDNIVHFTYDEIESLFDNIIVGKVSNDDNQIQYEEDIYRLLAFENLKVENLLITETTKQELKQLLAMKSSRSIANSIINVTLNKRNVYLYLELYQCLEYLFIVNKALKISSDYKLNEETAVKIVICENIKMGEIVSLHNLLQENCDKEVLKNFYNYIRNYNLTLSEADGEGQFIQKVSDFIYKLRCNIAHFKYKQDEDICKVDFIWLIENMSKIILNIYETMDDNIVNLCETTEIWKILYHK